MFLACCRKNRLITAFLTIATVTAFYISMITSRGFHSAGLAKPTTITTSSLSESFSNDITKVSGNDELLKLRQLLRLMQKAGKPKAIVYYLAKSSQMLMVVESIGTFCNHFNNFYQYPVVIFYEDTDDKFEEWYVRNQTSCPVFFQKVHFEIPSFINKSHVPMTAINGECPWKFVLGYRHMCRFQAVGVYQQPIMDDVEYALRLDDDSLILRNISYDIFAFMREKRLQYGFILDRDDDPLCVRGLWEATDVYIRNRSLTPYFYNEWPRNRIIFNNFELMASTLWKSESYRKFVDYIDRLGGIYFHRWGDAPIKSIAVSLFVPRNETHRFSDIGYEHGDGKNP